MKRLPLLFLCTIFQLLAQGVEALDAAGGAELTFFYQAYLLELEHVTDETRRSIAPGSEHLRNSEKRDSAPYTRNQPSIRKTKKLNHRLTPFEK
jgi:hypothetical protein